VERFVHDAKSSKNKRMEIVGWKNNGELAAPMWDIIAYSTRATMGKQSKKCSFDV
jgi:hypothetical protein